MQQGIEMPPLRLRLRLLAQRSAGAGGEAAGWLRLARVSQRPQAGEKRVA